MEKYLRKYVCPWAECIFRSLLQFLLPLLRNVNVSVTDQIGSGIYSPELLIYTPTGWIAGGSQFTPILKPHDFKLKSSI